MPSSRYRRSSPAERDSRIQALAPPDELSSHASVDAAIAAAAVAVLNAIYPDRAKTFEARQTELLNVKLAAGSHTASDLEAGHPAGRRRRRTGRRPGRHDGATAFWRGAIPDEPGTWKPAKPFRNDQPTEPLAGTWQPWLMTSGSQFRPGPPPAFEFARMAGRGGRDRPGERGADRRPDPDRPVLGGRRRHGHAAGPLDADRDRPRHARPAVAARHARLLAHLAMAQADAFIACWDAKYAYWSGRPIGLIPGFASTIITPNFPSYISGHSTVAGASAVGPGGVLPGRRRALAAQAEEAAHRRACTAASTGAATSRSASTWGEGSGSSRSTGPAVTGASLIDASAEDGDEACRGAVESLWFAKRGGLSTVSRHRDRVVRAML